MRLIDADALKLRIDIHGTNKFGMLDEDIRQFVDNEPTADVVERKHGKWMFTDAAPHRVYCSECYKTYIPNREWVAWKEDILPRNFCPNCGADMRGGEDVH